MTFEIISKREKRRKIILEAIRRDLKHSEIASQLGVNQLVILNDLRNMRINGDPELIEALKSQEQIRANKPSIASMNNKRFLNMTGMTFQEKSFRNMVDFNKHELLKILRSEDQNAAIFKLPKSIQKTLKRNGIITKRWKDNEITPKTLDYLFTLPGKK